MIDYIHCDEGCVDHGSPIRLALDLRYLDYTDRGHGDYITQHTAAAIARVAGWVVLHGAARDYHYCPMHRSSIAIVLRFAANEVRGEPRGIHAALHELGIGELTDIARGVWTVFHSVGVAELGLRLKLVAAAQRAEAEW